MSLKELEQLLKTDGLLAKVEGAGVKKRALLRLLCLPLYSPDQWQGEFSTHLNNLKRGSKRLNSILLQAARELERLILPLPQKMRSSLFAGLDIDHLASLLQALAHYIKPPPTAGNTLLSSLLAQPSNLKKGRPPVTSGRDHRILQLARLFKESSKTPHYGLVADVMNRAYECQLDEDQVKKAILRHPDERTYYPTALQHIAPTRVMVRRSKKWGKVKLYGPPSNKIVILD